MALFEQFKVAAHIFLAKNSPSPCRYLWNNYFLQPIPQWSNSWKEQENNLDLHIHFYSSPFFKT